MLVQDLAVVSFLELCCCLASPLQDFNDASRDYFERIGDRFVSSKKDYISVQ